MLAKLTDRNQLTLPASVTRAVGDAEYFEVAVVNGQIILTPVVMGRADAVRAKLAEMALSEQDVADAVAWARQV
ncbi:hypothetical protein [Trichothermofontia sp.]